MNLAGSLRAAAVDIKLHHSIFALPFALLGACLAAMDSISVKWSVIPWALIIGCMITGRTVAMLCNRILDASIDARNQRTAQRAIPSGAISKRAAGAMALGMAMLFILFCVLFGVLHQNWWPLWLAVPVLAWMAVYPLLKRWTWMCHGWLGASLAISVPAAALAVRPDAVAEPVVLWLAAMVLLWVSGFDVIYALQDVQVDRRDGLSSLPVALGESGAMWVSAGVHAAAMGCLVMAWISEPRLGAIFQWAIVATGVLLLIEHATVRTWGTTRMALTFFTINGCVSVVLGASGIAGLAGIGR